MKPRDALKMLQFGSVAQWNGFKILCIFFNDTGKIGYLFWGEVDSHLLPQLKSQEEDVLEAIKENVGRFNYIKILKLGTMKVTR